MFTLPHRSVLGLRRISCIKPFESSILQPQSFCSLETDVEAASVQDMAPSPVRFTSQCPEQFPVKPEPARPPGAIPGIVKSKMLSLENLNVSHLPSDAKEEVLNKLLFYHKI